MTTEPDNTIAAAEVWRAIGRLESDTATLKEGQSEIKADFESDLRMMNQRVGHLESDTATLKDGQSEVKADLEADLRMLNQRVGHLESDTATLKKGQREIKADLKSLNERIDKMLYAAAIAVGGALVVAILASNFIGN